TRPSCRRAGLWCTVRLACRCLNFAQKAAGRPTTGALTVGPRRRGWKYMRLRGTIMRAGAGRACLLLGAVLVGLVALAAVGWAAEPHPWQLGMQQPATPVKERIHAFHNELLVIISLITVFVLGLLAYVMVRFSAKRHPVPTRTSHNPVIEILWTVVPVVILVLIAIPSFKLMYYMDRIPNADMTIKVTGHQWYWTYEYPDQGDLSID